MVCSEDLHDHDDTPDSPVPPLTNEQWLENCLSDSERLDELVVMIGELVDNKVASHPHDGYQLPRDYDKFEFPFEGCISLCLSEYKWPEVTAAEFKAFVGRLRRIPQKAYVEKSSEDRKTGPWFGLTELGKERLTQVLATS